LTLADLERELADKTSIRRRVFSGFVELIRARSGSPAFDPYGPQQVMAFGSGVFALLRTNSNTGERVLCLQEVSGKPQSFDLDAERIFGPHAPDKGWIDLVSNRRHSCAPGSAFRLDPHQACWLTLCGESPQSTMERVHSP
jgi:sucrose phosphorylase